MGDQELGVTLGILLSGLIEAECNPTENALAREHPVGPPERGSGVRPVPGSWCVMPGVKPRGAR